MLHRKFFFHLLISLLSVLFVSSSFNNDLLGLHIFSNNSCKFIQCKFYLNLFNFINQLNKIREIRASSEFMSIIQCFPDNCLVTNFLSSFSLVFHTWLLYQSLSYPLVQSKLSRSLTFLTLVKACNLIE